MQLKAFGIGQSINKRTTRARQAAEKANATTTQSCVETDNGPISCRGEESSAG